MATSTYLKADPLKGESTDTKHTDWIEVFHFEHGLSQPASGPSGTGGLAAARADFKVFRIEKEVDKSSVDLNIHCASGKHIAKLELEVCQETGEKVCYLKYEFEDALVHSVDISGGGSERPAESVTFTYGKISWTYTAVKKDGTAGDKSGPKKWSLEENKGE
ncbi:Type VI secretion system secreted protein Hcp [Candidatus Methylobacter favarea]|uniref:Type VI secretion system secreted protein Hcp n=1 Tax=Candidatus Methylobacter favarea TaxID=2707345 RepID=A0A8S0XEG1_9GAMM|nr:type VI secretion system tube protein Hcp [Candidatus Methylobacter favarea]CAA9889682.1 Type VI secretion system secreted protein Hcp [Candidatus Methylobacter favarea]